MIHLKRLERCFRMWKRRFMNACVGQRLELTVTDYSRILLSPLDEFETWIWNDGEKLHLGTFDTAEEAGQMYLKTVLDEN